MKRILVVDGMGGGMGKVLVAAIKERIPDAELVACGTNALATQAMLKAGAHVAVTGENAVLYQAARCQVICGPLGIVIPNALQGEFSTRMAEAIASADAPKFLLPVRKRQIILAVPEPASVNEAVALLLDQLEAFWRGNDVEE